jgi:hypothetical protein
MFTYAQCRAIAEQKLAQAEHDPENRRRLIAAANGWLLLASRVDRRHNSGATVPEGASSRRTEGANPGVRLTVLDGKSDTRPVPSERCAGGQRRRHLTRHPRT